MDTFQETIVQSLLENVLTKAAHGLRKAASNTWEKFKTDYELVFTEYLRNAYQKYSKAKTLIYRNEPWPLIGDKGFFEAPLLNAETKSLLMSNNSFYVNSISDLLTLQNNYLIIQADGGMGKSTLMKYLFLSTLDDKGYIPVFIELRALNDIPDLSDKYDLSDFFFDKLYSLGSTLDQKYMNRTLSNGIYIFLLDGYDEITTKKREIFQRQFDKFVDMYPDNIFIVSSRRISQFFEFQRFSVYSIKPFGLFSAVSQIQKLKYDESIKEQFITALKDGLYNRHMDFASNPLLLNIMLLTYDNYGDLPKKLHHFYHAAFDTMLTKHDSSKGVFKREFRCKLSNDYDSDDFYIETFSHFCFITYCMGKTEFNRDEIKKILELIDKPINVDNYIYDLQNVLCVLFQVGTNYVFSHRSFQEYFTAVYLEKQDDILMEKYGLGIIKKNPSSLLGDNTFQMLSDMNRKRFNINILLPIVEYIKDGHDEEDLYHVFLHMIQDHLFIVMDGGYKEEWHLDLCQKKDDSLPLTILCSLLSDKCTCFFGDRRYFPSPTQNAEAILLTFLEPSETNQYFYTQDDTPIYHAFPSQNKEAIDLFAKTHYGEKLTYISKYIESIMAKYTKAENTLKNLLGFDL